MRKRKLNVLLATASTAALVGGLSPVSPASAQTGIVVLAGAVSGQVKLGDSDRNAAGATVSIEELNIEVTTGADGRFRIPNIPAGEYTLTVGYLGAADTSRSISVTEDGENVYAISIATDEIIVTGTRGALANARAQERATDNLTSVVTADDIGNFADQNVAESLQRLPGLTISRSEGEGRQVAIRGLSGSFVTVTVDGARLGARDEGNRSVDLDILSADLLNGIEVTKSLTPDQPADSVAGSIDLKTLSAFDRGGDSISLRGEVGYQEKSEDFNPRVSGDFTKIFETGAGAIGVAGGVSWQRRQSIVDEISHDDGLVIYAPDGMGGFEDFGQDFDDALASGLDPNSFIFLPARINLRADPAERTRLSANLNIEYRPTDSLELFARGTTGFFKDDDLRNRQRVRLDRQSGSEILALTPTSGSFEDSRSERRIRFSDQEDELYTASVGGQWTDDAWTVNAQLDYSLNDSFIPSVEPRFRADNFRVDFDNLTEEGVDITVQPEAGTTFGDEVETCVDQGIRNADDAYDPNDPCAYEFRFITAYDFISEDTIQTARLDIQRDFNLNGRPAFIKIGGRGQKRERDYDVERFRRNAEDDLTLNDIDQCPPLDGTDVNFFVNPCLDGLRAFGLDLRENGELELTVADATDSVARDYTVDETVWAGYLMTKFQLTDRLEFFGGVRIEDTKWETTGALSDIRTFSDTVSINFYNALTGAGVTDAQILASSLGARYQDNDNDGVIDLDGADPEVNESVFGFVDFISAENNYTDVFPNANIRWEPWDDIVIRASYTEAIQRPDFNQASANGGNRTAEATGDVFDDADQLAVTSIADAEALVTFDREFGGEERLRDPFLNPLTAQQYDLSLSWYPNQDTFLQAAFFYKDIEDFIFRLTSNDAADFGFDVSDLVNDPTLTLRNIEIDSWVNGDSAEVYGVELTYSQNYTFLPGFWGGLFAYANLTLSQSDAFDPLVGRSFTLPDQADVSGNYSVGWENEDFSFRFSGNYVGERLRFINEGRLGTEFGESDLFEKSRFSMDINAKYNVTDGIQLYFDATNINNAEDRRFFEPGGASGRVLGVVETYGATYQLGVRARF